MFRGGPVAVTSSAMEELADDLARSNAHCEQVISDVNRSN
jgi:hypothetical protein